MNYRSGLEEKLGKYLDKVGCSYLYEVEKFDYVTHSKYTPDFFLPNGVIIEAKGFFKPSDRRKMLAVKQMHPHLDIRFVFMRDNALTKTSKTTYTMWAEKHGFPACIFPHLPEDWLR